MKVVDTTDQLVDDLRTPEVFSAAVHLPPSATVENRIGIHEGNIQYPAWVRSSENFQVDIILSNIRQHGGVRFVPAKKPEVMAMIRRGN